MRESPSGAAKISFAKEINTFAAQKEYFWKSNN